MDPCLLLDLKESGFESRDVVNRIRCYLGRVLVHNNKRQCRREEGGLGAVYKVEGERSESLLSILYLTVLLGAHNFQSSKERVFYCKGNLAVSRQSLRLARENPKRIL